MRMRLMVRAGQFRTQGTELLIVHPPCHGRRSTLESWNGSAVTRCWRSGLCAVRILHGHWLGRRCLLPAYRSRGPMQISQGKNTGCTAAPALNTAPTSVGFWASRSLARSPDRPGLYEAFFLLVALEIKREALE
jgi:hypothetical protein